MGLEKLNTDKSASTEEVLINGEHYYSREIARLEEERLWPKVWLIVCREQELKDRGDYVVHDINKESIFVIRTEAPCWRSRPHRFLVMTSLGALAVALILALTPLGHSFGFVALPVPVLLVILAIAACYLVFAELLKPLAMRAEGKRGRVRTHHLKARRFRAF